MNLKLPRYIIVSNSTFTGVIIPDSVASYLGLPVTDGEDQPINYTIQSALAAGALGTAPPFPVIEDENGAPRRELEEGETPTDWVCPISNMGGALDLYIKQLAEAKPVPYEVVMLSNSEVRAYLKDGTTPDPIV